MMSRNARMSAVAILAVVSALAVHGAPPAVDLRLAELHPIDHPTAKADFEFARLVKERSDGRITISVYTDSVLGQEMAVLDQVQFGAIDIARVSLAAVAVYVPRLVALQMPYLYSDGEHMPQQRHGSVVAGWAIGFRVASSPFPARDGGDAAHLAGLQLGPSFV